MFGWFKEISAGEKRTFWACFGGWALDALDVQMFSLVIPTIIAAWHIGKTEAGLVSGITLVASALGGWIAGAMTDRLGRVRTLQITVAWFSLATFASAFAQNFEQFLALKAVQGFGFGGEWAAGAVLMAESIRASHRGKAMGTVQSAWAVGWGAAVLLYALTYSLVEPDLAWRVMFARACCRRCSSSTSGAACRNRRRPAPKPWPGPTACPSRASRCSTSSARGCCA